MNIARLNFSHGSHEVGLCTVLLCVPLLSVTVVHMFWSFLQSCVDSPSPSMCLSVPRGNHQKHPRGGGDDNLWPLVLPAGCHRLGYEGSRDPHWISERGKHLMLDPPSRLKLIRRSHPVSCETCWQFVDCFLSSSFLTGCCLHFLCPHLLFNHLVLLLHAVCFAEQITQSSWKPLHALISSENVPQDVLAARWFSLVFS